MHPFLFLLCFMQPDSLNYNYMKANILSRATNSPPAKPLPNSKPLVAGNDIAAFASSASSLSKTGEPSPCNDQYFNLSRRLIIHIYII